MPGLAKEPMDHIQNFIMRTKNKENKKYQEKIMRMETV